MTTNNIEDRLNDLEADVADRLQELEDRVDSLEDEVENLEGDVDELERENDDLEREVDRLSSQYEREQQKRRGLERTIAHIERDITDRLDFLTTDVWDLEDIVYGDLDGAAADVHVQNDGDVFTRLEHLETRVEEVAHGEVDAAELAAQQAGPSVEDLTPLHQLYTTATNLEPYEHDLSSNQEIAARLFPHLAQYATPHGEELHLSSNKLRDVIEREIATPELAKRLDVRHPNRNTVRRVMEFIGRFGKDLLEFAPASSTDRRNDKNLVIIDREAWREYTNQFSDGDDVTSVTATNSESEGSQQVLTDGGGDVTLS
ncbi:hypothetical protein [Halorubellus sp. PRR65]|uniref:hypothetical protein n=1 Tax=Halorubellus sp. PRR65 TaxID=3098148 RepID=UPI002B25D393|nr:hypothetical protein [Halorubellus sp. PRR65]